MFLFAYILWIVFLGGLPCNFANILSFYLMPKCSLGTSLLMSGIIFHAINYRFRWSVQNLQLNLSVKIVRIYLIVVHIFYMDTACAFSDKGIIGLRLSCSCSLTVHFNKYSWTLVFCWQANTGKHRYLELRRTLTKLLDIRSGFPGLIPWCSYMYINTCFSIGIYWTFLLLINE